MSEAPREVDVSKALTRDQSRILLRDEQDAKDREHEREQDAKEREHEREQDVKDRELERDEEKRESAHKRGMEIVAVAILVLVLIGSGWVSTQKDSDPQTLGAARAAFTSILGLLTGGIFGRFSAGGARRETGEPRREPRDSNRGNGGRRRGK